MGNGFHRLKTNFLLKAEHEKSYTYPENAVC